MSRTSACIQMLILLKARGFMSREELADKLNCKIRNILEYKKELENAGYVIESTTGKYGGYKLYRGALLPVNSFLNEEVRALQEARLYMESRHDFLLMEAYLQAMDKLQATLSAREENSDIYMGQEPLPISKKMRKLIELCEQAKKYQNVIDIQYRSLRAQTKEHIQVHPYEILNYKGSYYCLGYSLKAKDYRMYKFSEERMFDIVITSHQFQRDAAFHIKDHIGKSGLVKDEIIELDLYVFKESARRVAEKHIGIEPYKEWIDENTLHVKTMMEGKVDCISFLLSLRGECKLLSPTYLEKEMLGIIEDMKRAYSHSS